MRPNRLHCDLVNTLPCGNDSIRIRLGSLVPPSLQTYECHFNWLQLHPNYPLSVAELDHGVLLLEEKFRDESREIYDENRSSLHAKNSLVGIFLIAKKLTQAHFNIELQRYQKAKECLIEVEMFINRWNENNPNPDYREGFQYIVEGLEAFLEDRIRSAASPTLTIGEKTPVELLGLKDQRGSGSGGFSRAYCPEGLKHFKRLPAKAKYTVWTVRDVFLIYCSTINVERGDWMEAILLEMEPYTSKWHFYLYRALHGRRKLVRRPLPLLLLDDDEQVEEGLVGNQDASNKLIGGPCAAGVVDDDPLSISYQCMCLAQMFTEKECKIKNGKRWTNSNSASRSGSSNNGSFGDAALLGGNGSFNQCYPWRFGQHTFETSEQVLECILDKTIQVLELDCHLDGVYLNLSEVHMFLLPPENRSMELVVRCLKKALRLNSKNPKAHYRMGLAHFKLKNHKQATDHFREAIQNPNYIGAIYGLIQLLMAQPIENSIEIQSIFKFAMKNLDLIRDWGKRCLRTLHYLKGCYHFMLQDIGGDDCLNEAITSWIIAHDNESPKWSYYFLNLAHQSARFQWPTKRLNLANVSNALKHAAYLEQTQFRQLLLDICSEVDDAIRRSSERNSPASSNNP